MSIREHRVTAFCNWLDTIPPDPPFHQHPSYRFFSDLSDAEHEAAGAEMKRRSAEALAEADRLQAIREAKNAPAGTTYATGKPLPPRSEWELFVFFRDGDTFYGIDLPADDDLNLHARLNSGTVRIENLAGDVLWPEGTKQ